MDMHPAPCVYNLAAGCIHVGTRAPGECTLFQVICMHFKCGCCTNDIIATSSQILFINKNRVHVIYKEYVMQSITGPINGLFLALKHWAHLLPAWYSLYPTHTSQYTPCGGPQPSCLKLLLPLLLCLHFHPLVSSPISWPTSSPLTTLQY